MTTPLFWEHQDKLQAYLEEQEPDMAVYFAAEKKASAEKVKTWLSEIGAIEQEYFKALTDYAEKDEDAKAAVGRSTTATLPAMDKDVAADRLVEDNTRLDAEGKRVLNVTIRSPEGEAMVHVGPGIKGKILLAQWDDLRRDVVRKYGLSEEQEAKALEIYRDHEAGLEQYLAANLEEIAGYLGSLDRFETERDGGNNGAAFQKERAWKQMLKLRGEVKLWLADVEKMDDAYQWALWQNLTDQQKDQGDLPLATTRADLMSFAIKYGLAAIGLCLLLGFCTRLSALGGAAFMFSVLLTQPPWPTIYPPAPAVLGHALLVDKNFVEMVALLVLASTAVGRWGGLDHFVYRYLGEPLLLRLKKEKGVTQEDEQAGESDESKS